MAADIVALLDGAVILTESLLSQHSLLKLP
jgi:hypothetical protein